MTTARSSAADAAARLELLMAVAAVADATHPLDDVMPRLLASSSRQSRTCA